MNRTYLIAGWVLTPTVGVAAVLTLAIAPAAAQTPSQKPKFEVASIKPNRSGSLTTSNGFQACRFVATNATLKMMLRFAYRLSNGQTLPNNRVIGGPNWMDTDHFDVEAKPEPGIDSIPLDRFLLMVQSLLEERFQSRTHWDTRDLPVYELVVGKDRPKLKKSANRTQLPTAARNPVLRCSQSPALSTAPPLPPGARAGSPARGPIAIDFVPPREYP